MKTMILFLAVMTMFLFSCRKDKNVDLPSNSDNLIANPSFETISHQPDYSGWTGTAYLFDSLGHQNFPLVQDAPQGGGLWCVQVEPLWAPQEGFTETMLTGQTGTHNYQLTLLMKTIHWRGLISLEQWRNGQLIDDKNLSDTSISSINAPMKINLLPYFTICFARTNENFNPIYFLVIRIPAAKVTTTEAM